MKFYESLDIFNRIVRWRFFFAALLVPINLVFWFSFESKTILPLHDHGNQYDNSKGVVDLGYQPVLCSALKLTDGFFLISGLIEDLPANGSFGFLQTDEAETGLFFDFDQVPRVGLVSANDTMSYAVVDPALKQIKGQDRLAFMIFLSADGVLKYYENENLVQLLPINPGLECKNVRIGMGNESGPYPGRISVSISSGSDIAIAESLTKVYESQFHSTATRAYALSKKGLIVALILLFVGNPFKKRDPLKPTGEPESN